MTMTCEHPEDKMREAVLYEPSEARYCGGCRSIVFADGHAEPVQITKISTSKR